jgi:hypothetical protein
MKTVLLKTALAAISFIMLSSSFSLAWSQSHPFSVRPKVPPIQRVPGTPTEEQDPLVQQLPPLQPYNPFAPQPPTFEMELPPGVRVFPNYCPHGYEEIPNGAELYNVRPGVIVGFKTAKPVVCRDRVGEQQVL